MGKVEISTKVLNRFHWFFQFELQVKMQWKWSFPKTIAMCVPLTFEIPLESTQLKQFMQTGIRSLRIPLLGHIVLCVLPFPLCVSITPLIPLRGLYSTIFLQSILKACGPCNCIGIYSINDILWTSKRIKVDFVFICHSRSMSTSTIPLHPQTDYYRIWREKKMVWTISIPLLFTTYSIRMYWEK